MRATINFNHFDHLLEQLSKLDTVLDAYRDQIKDERVKVPEPDVIERWFLKFLKPKIRQRTSFDDTFGDKADEHIGQNWWAPIEDAEYYHLASLVSSFHACSKVQHSISSRVKSAALIKAASVTFTDKELEDLSFWIRQIQ